MNLGNFLRFLVLIEGGNVQFRTISIFTNSKWIDIYCVTSHVQNSAKREHSFQKFLFCCLAVDFFKTVNIKQKQCT